MATFPQISHYITSYDPEGKSTYLDAPDPPRVFPSGPTSRVDYIYSAVGSATGPLLKDDIDCKAHQHVMAGPQPILFPVEGSSDACVVAVSHYLLPTSE
jgi:hypothetical protein